MGRPHVTLAGTECMHKPCSEPHATQCSAHCRRLQHTADVPRSHPQSQQALVNVTETVSGCSHPLNKYIGQPRLPQRHQTQPLGRPCAATIAPLQEHGNTERRAGIQFEPHPARGRKACNTDRKPTPAPATHRPLLVTVPQADLPEGACTFFDKECVRVMPRERTHCQEKEPRPGKGATARERSPRQEKEPPPGKGATARERSHGQGKESPPGKGATAKERSHR